VGARGAGADGGEGAPPQAEVSAAGFRADFETAWREVAATYAYFDLKATRWSEIPRLYGADLERVRTREEFIGLLERVIDELYDAHAQLTVNTGTSPRLVPSGTDLWAEWRGARATILDVRARSDAERADIRPGTIVVALDGVPIAEAVARRLGRSYPASTPAARDWALRAVLAGTHNKARTLRLRSAKEVGEGIAGMDRNERLVVLPAPDQVDGAAAPVTVSRLPSGVGLVTLNDSLGDSSTVAAFDKALNALRDAPGLLIDLRNTPRGGNSSVARGILGRFVARETPYQRHLLPAEESATGIRRSWLELVSPRGGFVFDRPAAILVGYWTGSMGEGLAIGFDAACSCPVVGTPMAGLLGATYPVQLPNTGIGLNLPAERLSHVNGTPREAFRPDVEIDLARALPGEDLALAAALRALAAR